MSEEPRRRVAAPALGEVTFRPFELESDARFLHDWVNRDYAYFWGLQGASLERVIAEYRTLTAPDHYEVFVGEHRGRPAFVLERYDPRQDIVGEHYPAAPTDRGIHVIVAPPGRVRIPNFTWHMFEAILDFVFAEPGVDRVLVEPDIRNKKMFTLCERVGFETERIVELPHKTAQLAFVTRARHLEIRRSGAVPKRSTMNHADNFVSPQQSTRHINRSRWERVNRALVRKALCEFTHERLLAPTCIEPRADGFALYELQNGAEPPVRYAFVAKPLPLEHLWIDEDSIRVLASAPHPRQGEHRPAVDAVQFIKDFREPLGISPSQLPLYLEEILSTLQGAVFKLTKGNPSARGLLHADFQTLEQSMTEGHPCFVANNGRIGFDSTDYRSYAPEAGNSFSLLWLAGHRRKAVYAGIDELPYEQLIAHELDADTRARFEAHIRSRGADPSDYYFMPIHPWQWFNKLASVFASEVASGDLICLGYGPDQYLAQQSVRTLFNVTNPTKFYTKSALSILNMGFMRGLPLYYLGTAPHMHVWLEQRLYSDPYIQQTGFRMLGEIASVSYVNPYFEEFGPHNDFNKMLASLWRESPASLAGEGQVAMTMAALLHVDDGGEAFLIELIRASGLSTPEWLARYLDTYLAPLLHCFYAHDLVFMPHGENLILIMDEHVPVRALLKDITEEAAILSPEVELPEALARMYVEVPEDVKALSIFIDIFDDFFRFMAELLEAHGDCTATEFWGCVAACVRRYQARFPELADKFARYDLFAPSFKLSCLNRLQIRNHRQMIDLDEPVGRLQFVGAIDNPLAPFAARPQRTSGAA